MVLLLGCLRSIVGERIYRDAAVGGAREASSTGYHRYGTFGRDTTSFRRTGSVGEVVVVQNDDTIGRIVEVAGATAWIRTSSVATAASIRLEGPSCVDAGTEGATSSSDWVVERATDPCSKDIFATTAREGKGTIRLSGDIRASKVGEHHIFKVAAKGTAWAFWSSSTPRASCTSLKTGTSSTKTSLARAEASDGGKCENETNHGCEYRRGPEVSKLALAILKVNLSNSFNSYDLKLALSSLLFCKL